jgi:type IV pilus assembly protein PilQ
MRNRLRPKGRYSWRYQDWLAAAALVSAMVVVPALVQAAAEAPPAASGVRVEEVVVSKTPYYTNIEATVSGKIENYNSFKLNDPFRIVVDIWGVAQGAVASELPAGTPQVKSVKLSQQGDKLRMLVETPDDAPFPFLVTTEGNRLVLSVGGGQEGKVTSLDRPAAGMEPSKGKTVVGIDLEDLPDMSNVVVTTSGDISHKVVEGKDSVTLVFPGASSEKGLLREMDARKFDIPIRRVRPEAGKMGIEVAVTFAPGSRYSVKEKDNAVVVSFPKVAGVEKGAVVAELSRRTASSSMPAYAERERESARRAPKWGFVTHAVESRKKYVGQRISLDFKDADLANVFRIIAEVSNLNIITTDDVKGRVSVRLINVPWDQALDIVLKSKALGATHEGNILRIAPLATLRAEDKARLDAKKEVEKLQASLEGVIETIPVNYGKASDLKGKITDLLSEGGKVQIDDRTNTIIIRDLRKNVEDVKSLVAKLDTATPQVLIEARIVEVDTSFTRELGVQWGGSYKGGGDPTIGITGIQDTAGAYIPGQGLVNTINTTPSAIDTPPNFAVNLPAAVGLGAGGGITFGVLSDNIRLDLSLSALEASGKGKVVSSPKVVTIDNKEAMIEQGTQIPYSTVSASGTNTEFVDATLSLKVTPHITPEGSVIMKLEAKNDSQGDVGASGQPAINKKKATTEVLVRDGETAVIGGILQVTRKEDQQAVPWLSKIPILGFFFKKDTTQSSNRELLIFITPKILRPEPVQARIY